MPLLLLRSPMEEYPVNQDLCNDVRAYALCCANRELALGLRHPASNC